jgi:hypothetical protein
MVSEFFGISKTVFDFFFRSESSVSVFLGIGIGHRNRYRNRYSPLPTVFFGYVLDRNLPKLMGQPKF